MAKQRHIRFSISTLLLVTAIAALYLANNPYQAFHPREISMWSTADKNGISMVHTAIRRHKADSAKDVVDFVVIQRRSEPQELQSLVRITYSSSMYDPSAVFELPDGAIELPSDRTLLQLSDDEFTSLNVQIETRVLNDFLSSYSSRFTIEQLAAMLTTDKQAEP